MPTSRPASRRPRADAAAGARKSRPQGRAAAIGLTREQVLQAGVALVEEMGVESFSIRELSRRLEVYPAAIYWHLGGNKDDLLSELTAVITTNLLTPDELCADWRDSLRLFARRYRAAAQKHPHLANLIGAQLRANGPAHAALTETLLTILRQAGLSGAGMIDAMNMLIGGIFGYATMELAPVPVRSDPEWGVRFRESIDALDPATFPETHRLSGQLANRAFALRWSNGTEVPLDGGFDLLIEALILMVGRCGTGAAGHRD